MKKQAVAAFCAAFFMAVPCFAGSASGVSVGSSMSTSQDVPVGSGHGSGYSHSEGNFDDSESQGWSTNCGNSSCSGRQLSEKEAEQERDKAPLVIISDGGIPFSVSVSPMKLNTMMDDDVSVIFSTPFRVKSVGLTYRDPYSKTLRHVPVAEGVPVEIISKEHVRSCKGITRLYFNVVLDEGVSTTAVLDLHVLDEDGH